MPGSRKRRGRWALLLIAAMAIGALMLLHYGERFVFAYAEAYRSFSLWSLVLFSPFVLYRLKRARASDELAKKYPTDWVRNGIVMPLAAAMAVGLVLAAPVGWLFAAVAWSDVPVDHVRATAIEVGAYARRKGCDQHATLRLASADKETCLDGLFRPAAMRPGQRLDVGIKPTPFGFLIVSVSDQGVQ